MKNFYKIVAPPLVTACSMFLVVQAYAQDEALPPEAVDEKSVDEIVATAVEDGEIAMSELTTIEDEARKGSTVVSSMGESGKTYDFISDGTRIELTDKDFTIVPPRGWEVFTTHPSLSLLMQMPHEPGIKYQRTIQAASFSGPRYMDDVTAQEIEQLITKKFSEVSASVVDYRIRNHMAVEMADGRDGLLFYSEFKIDGVELMQAHILVSSTKRHYVMTFTDLAEHFENDDQSQYLTEAWESMTSVELEGRTPVRFESVAFISIGAGVLFAVCFAGWAFNRWRAGRKFAEYAAGHGFDDQEPLTGELHSFAANSSFVSGALELKSKPASSFAPMSSQFSEGPIDFKSRAAKGKGSAKSKGKASKAPQTDYNSTVHEDEEDMAV